MASLKFVFNYVFLVPHQSRKIDIGFVEILYVFHSHCSKDGLPAGVIEGELLHLSKGVKAKSKQKHFITGSEGNSKFCLPVIQNLCVTTSSMTFVSLKHDLSIF